LVDYLSRDYIDMSPATSVGYEQNETKQIKRVLLTNFEFLFPRGRPLVQHDENKLSDSRDYSKILTLENAITSDISVITCH
jgi:hypothetical protein